jgi:cytochrome P450
VVAINGEVHGRQRKNVSHAFSARAVEEQEGLVRGYVVFLVGRLE